MCAGNLWRMESIKLSIFSPLLSGWQLDNDPPAAERVQRRRFARGDNGLKDDIINDARRDIESDCSLQRARLLLLFSSPRRFISNKR